MKIYTHTAKITNGREWSIGIPASNWYEARNHGHLLAKYHALSLGSRVIEEHTYLT